ncbi:F-box domain-containing protein [Mycena kentingensis (nom. inval.)]|nr:F-box domain-containing protein [Mycena kentingensis (nom. inval.)]
MNPPLQDIDPNRVADPPPPIQRLPEDVLRVIFVLTLPAHRNAALDASESPLLLCSVSKHWRDLAMEMPRLWATMHLVVPDDVENLTLERMLAMATIWLQRSGAVPLSVTTRPSSAMPIPMALDFRKPSPEMPLLVSSPGRWEEMDLVCSRIGDLLALSKLAPEETPVLKSISLTLSPTAMFGGGLDVNLPELYPSHPLRFLATPSLRRFSYLGVNAALPLTLVWVNITSLRLTVVDAAPCPFPFVFLKDCLNLELLALSVSLPLFNLDERVSLPQLKSLSLTFPDGEVGSASALLDAPKLTALHLMHGSQSNTGEHILPSLPAHTRCQLTKLSLSIYGSDSGVLDDALRALPALQALRLMGEPTFLVIGDTDVRETDPTFLARFILVAGQLESPFCPALRSLRLEGMYYLSDALLMQVVVSRAGGSETSTSFRFSAFIPRERQLDIAADPEV